MKLEKDQYFSDDCIIEDQLYISLKDLLMCPLCHKILKDPYMCNICQNVYCKRCLEDYSQFKICPNECKDAKFIRCLAKNELLSKIKYRCKNCQKEVIQSDIKAHLESNCEHSEVIQKKKTLAEEIKTKKELIKLSKEEMKGKKIDYSLTGKNIF